MRRALTRTMLYPANGAGYAVDQFDLTDYPLEISLNENTSSVTLWILAVHNTRYYAAEMFGLGCVGRQSRSGLSELAGRR